MSVVHEEFNESFDETEIIDEINFNLTERQKQVVEWMIAKEKEAPYGGIIGMYKIN